MRSAALAEAWLQLGYGRAAIWGTSPVVDGRIVFGDKSGYVYILSADNGELVTELKIGDNVDATPAVLDGRIYVGAFNGKFFCMGEDEAASTQAASPQAASSNSPVTPKP